MENNHLNTLYASFIPVATEKEMRYGLLSIEISISIVYTGNQRENNAMKLFSHIASSGGSNTGLLCASGSSAR